jgi:hypothetical protein
MPVSGRTIFRLFPYPKKFDAVNHSSKLEEFGFPNTSTNSCSDEIEVISLTGPLAAVITIAPLVVETAGITFVKSFSVTRTPGDT